MSKQKQRREREKAREKQEVGILLEAAGQTALTDTTSNEILHLISRILDANGMADAYLVIERLKKNYELPYT